MTTKTPLRSLDTSIILRLIDKNHPILRKKAESLIENQDNQFHISFVAIMETEHILHKILHFDRQTTAALLNTILLRPNISFDKNLFSATLSDYLSHPKLSFNDCYLTHEAESSSATPLLTFDEKLSHQLPSTQKLS